MRSHDGISPVGVDPGTHAEQEARRVEEEARSAAIRQKMQGTAVRRRVTQYEIDLKDPRDVIITRGRVVMDMACVSIIEGEGEKAITQIIPWHRITLIQRSRVVAL
jgi:tRNA(Ser,Leu) C12 N-acetylase TAN1